MQEATKEEAYWREQHAQQPYAKKELSYDDYAAAYRTGYEGFHKYPGKLYEEIESDLALDYQRTQAGAALPWDHARHAVPRGLGESQPRHRPARFRPRNPQRNLKLTWRDTRRHVPKFQGADGADALQKNWRATEAADTHEKFRRWPRRRSPSRSCFLFSGNPASSRVQSAPPFQSGNGMRRN